MLDLFFSCPLPNGLHARPASALEAVARRFAADLTLQNMRTGQAANAKSVLAQVGLDVRFDDRCRLTASGEDEREAITALASFLDVEFPRCDAPLPAPEPAGDVQFPPVLRRAGPSARRGLPLAPGIGRGRLVRVGGFAMPDALVRAEVSDEEAEVERLDDAFRRLLTDYDEQAHQLGRGVQADIMAAHRSVARDPELRQWLVAEIRRRRTSAAGAIVAAEDHFSAVLSTTGSDILRDRALDIRDVCVRLARQLYGEQVGGGETRLDAESICVADTLTPGEFLSLDRNLLKGVVLARGSATSHTAILARSFAVPMLGGLTGLDSLEQDGAEAIVDADLGALVTGFDQSVLRYYDMERSRLAGRRARQDAVAAQAATTSDGWRIEVAANIASAAEADAAFSAGAEGIGLFRTELLFAGRRQAPDEAEQFDEYRRVLERAGHRRVLIRTLDVGGDKPLPYLRLPAEDNPYLGCRGVRLYAGHDALIRGQVRALVRASAGGNLGLMLPMISRLDEVRLARTVIVEEQARCTAEGVPFDTRMQVGAMIEVPSAAFALPELAAELDFFSVGTNDLLQYFVAADRSNRQVADLYNAFAPPFLRLLEKIVCGVHQAGRSVGICGEMAADVNALPLLVGLGFDDISMAPPGIGSSKAAVRRLSAAACRDLLAGAVSCATAGEVEALVRNADCWRPAPLIEPGLVILDADCRSKDEAIKALVDQLYIDGRTDEPRRIEEAVWDREAVYSTGFGHGFAIPHCKTDQLRSTSLVMLRMQQPVDWNALDGQPVGFALLLAIRGTDHEKAHMKVLATLARQLMHEEFRERLAREPDSNALCRFLLDRIGGSE